MPIKPEIRAMLLGDDLTPLSQLSAAFLAPKTGLHVQFAYFESSLAIDFLVRRSGLDALKGVLDDLGAGIALNDSLPRRTKTSLQELDRDFTKFARDWAKGVAPDATWEEPDLPRSADSAALTAWLAKHPKSFFGLRRLAGKLVMEEKWAKAKEVLETLKRLYPEYVGPENAYVLLAAVYKKLSDTVAERAILEELAARSSDACAAYLRLMELDEAAKDWPALAKNARRMLAANPLVAAPHRGLALALEQIGQADEAVTAYRAVAMLDDSDPAGVHFHLARLLSRAGKRDEARREVLKSLDEAPRFLDAHKLLLELTDHAGDATPKPAQ
jgi:tetratricopeptide (TPR) repeat protein